MYNSVKNIMDVTVVMEHILDIYRSRYIFTIYTHNIHTIYLIEVAFASTYEQLPAQIGHLSALEHVGHVVVRLKGVLNAAYSNECMV